MKNIQNITGIRELKNMHSTGIRSIPKAMRSGFLELYLLKNELERLEKEIFILDKKRHGTGMQLNSVNKQIKKLQKEILGKQKNKSAKIPFDKHIRSIPIKY